MIKRLEHFISTTNDIQLFGYVLGYLCLKHSTTQTKHNNGLLHFTYILCFSGKVHHVGQEQRWNIVPCRPEEDDL